MKIELSNKEADLRKARDHDWEGNNAAFKCPMCGFVFLVSGLIHKGKRTCPKCERSVARVERGRKSGGRAWIEWSMKKEAK